MSDRPDWRRYVAEDGQRIVVPRRVAVWLSNRAQLDRLRTSVRGLDSEVDGVLLAFRIMTVSESCGDVAPKPQLESPSRTVGVAAAASTLGISPQAIRKVAGGRLRASKADDGAWVIAREDVEDYRATRRRRR